MDDLFECMMIHGLANPKFRNDLLFQGLVVICLTPLNVLTDLPHLLFPDTRPDVAYENNFQNFSNFYRD